MTWFDSLPLRTIVLMIIFSQYLDQAWVPVPNNIKCRWSKKSKSNCKWQSPPPYQRFCQIPHVRHVPRPPHHLDHVDPLRNPHTGADCICLLVLVLVSLLVPVLLFVLVSVVLFLLVKRPPGGGRSAHGDKNRWSKAGPARQLRSGEDSLPLSVSPHQLFCLLLRITLFCQHV